MSPEEIEAKAREDLERDLQMYLDLARYSGSLRNHQIAGYDTGDAELSSALKEIFLPLCFQKIYTSKIRHSMDVDTVNLLYILLDDAESHIVDKNQQGAILSNLSNTLL